MRKTRSGCDGFTLVEALVGVTILAVSLAGSMALMMNMLRANAFSTRMTAAVSLAQDKVDELIETGFVNAASGTDAVDIHRRAWTVANNGGIKAIDVTVTWPSVDNQQRQVTLNTMVTDGLK